MRPLSRRAGEAQKEPLTPAYDRIAKRIGMKLREIYAQPEALPLPVEHVDLLLRLRQKERDRARRD